VRLYPYPVGVAGSGIANNNGMQWRGINETELTGARNEIGNGGNGALLED
jgi:hypothetical protein